MLPHGVNHIHPCRQRQAENGGTDCSDVAIAATRPFAMFAVSVTMLSVAGFDASRFRKPGLCRAMACDFKMTYNALQRGQGPR
jgi:hypothetical protein